MMNNIMLDLETFGVSNSAAIISIGAVMFDLQKFELGPSFHVKIDLKGHNLGKIDGSTVLWWLGQSDAAVEALLRGERVSPVEALKKFCEWLNKDVDYFLWSSGPTFDSVILRSAFDRHSMKWPFKYNADRDFRTIRDIGSELFPLIRFEADKAAHDALIDATEQARYTVSVCKELYGRKQRQKA